MSIKFMFHWLKSPASPVKKNLNQNFKNFDFLTLRHPTAIHECTQKNFSRFGPVFWPAIGDINTNLLIYYIDLFKSSKQFQPHEKYINEKPLIL